MRLGPEQLGKGESTRWEGYGRLRLGFPRVDADPSELAAYLEIRTQLQDPKGSVGGHTIF